MALGCDADVTDFPVAHDGLDALKIGKEAPLGNGGDMGADAALFLGLAAAPDMAAFDGADAR